MNTARIRRGLNSSLALSVGSSDWTKVQPLLWLCGPWKGASSSNALLDRIRDLGTGVQKPFDCLVMQNHQAICVPLEGRWIGHWRTTWSTACFSAPHSQSAVGSMPHLGKQERKCSTPVRRRLRCSWLWRIYAKAMTEGPALLGAQRNPFFWRHKFAKLRWSITSQLTLKRAKMQASRLISTVTTR